MRCLLLACLAVWCMGCNTNDDCNGGGLCVQGTCKCDFGFKGAACEQVNFGASYKCGEGGLCLSYQFNTTSTWGGGVAKGDDGKYHMYGAMMNNNCTLQSWLTNSQVLHSVSDTVHGPYTPHDVSLGQLHPSTATWDGLTEHNPIIARAPNGTYLLYYMGSTATGAVSQNCTIDEKDLGSNTCSSNPASQPVCNQQIGLATSNSPNGPWERSKTPILSPGPAGAWDDQFVTNPTVHVFPNSSVLMVYKARSKENYNAMLTGVAFAEHWSGPYIRASPSVPFQVPSECEDSGMYYSEAQKTFRILMHCGCNYLYLWSKDGYNWKSTPQVPWCDITYTDGTTETLRRRERPQWIVDGTGKPIFLTNGVEGTTSHGGMTWTMATPINP